MNPPPADTTSDVLAGFESRFTEFADAFATGQYVLWLGSGISRDRMPPVPDLVRAVVELLRSKIDPTDPNCRFRAALTKVLALSSLSHETKAALDLTVPVAEWPVEGDLVRSLVNNYSQVLGVRVANEEPDYLMWTGLDVPNTYGNRDIEPDVEHLCIGILMLEGVVDSAATSNWDGLVEKAVHELCPDADQVLRVVVDSEDFRKPSGRSDLIKFHGCAIRAVENQAKYRPMLIAQEKQISGWSVQPANAYMRNKLQALLGERNTLVIGLSLQDANMHTMFAASAQDLGRRWPAQPPALVLSEQTLQPRHEMALQFIYGDDFDDNEDDIVSSAVLGSWAKPTLLALVLWTLTEKLAELTGHVPTPGLSEADVARLKVDLRMARTTFGSLVGEELSGFLDALVSAVTATLSMFRDGRAANGDRTYMPLTVSPLARAVQSPDFPAASLGRFAIALSLLSRGHHASDWAAAPEPMTGSFRVKTGVSEQEVFLVRDTRESLTLELSHDFDEDAAVVVIHADRQVPRSTRSPRSAYGRSGSIGVGRFSIEELLDDADSADDLYAAFKMAGGFK